MLGSPTGAHLSARSLVDAPVLTLMSSHAKRLAVVPAYNESATVARVVHAIHDRAPGVDVLVIDDGSTDDTREDRKSVV